MFSGTSGITLPGRISTRTFDILTERGRVWKHQSGNAPLRGGGDDLWHVEVILAPWIPSRAHPRLTTTLWRSVHPVVGHLAGWMQHGIEKESPGEKGGEENKGQESRVKVINQRERGPRKANHSPL
ncbi:hypothetical protein N7468_009012 [Penicillium chermesinum]|uniref:Uncharacterized protein n=1 Tax=Penicillium chermesinum TaxID=63820 RepID=A0A9W9NHE9_9EURO|nr:uncharacterized protein N7468_009012 [Penicillium chermesinum]KAJ5219808.1 hypothetical protein N7468_009012 [Penicillium chermesinum]